MNCPNERCPDYGRPMKVVTRTDDQILYKCPRCGQMSLVTKDDEEEVTQEWGKNDVR